MAETLIQFVEQARNKGLDYATIRLLLRSAGWKEQEIADVICQRELEQAIPRPQSVHSVDARERRNSVWPRLARDVFLHLLAFGTLFTWGTSLILLFFTYIDFALPDPAWKISYSAVEEVLSIARAELAVLIVTFPIYLVTWHFLLHEVHRDPGKTNGVIRRWLAYLAIFVGALTLSGDVVALIFLLLEGQLTARLLLKMIALFLIAGSLVLYLVLTLRSETEVEK